MYKPRVIMALVWWFKGGVWAESGLQSLFEMLFTHRYTWQNFRLSLLHLVNRLYAVIHRTQKTKTKVLPCVTMGE